MSGNDAATLNGKTWECKIENIITSKIGEHPEYTLSAQYSYTFGNAAFWSRRKRKIDFCIMKNKQPFCFFEAKSQNVGGTASEKASEVLSNFKKIVNGRHVEYCVFLTDGNENGFRVFENDLKDSKISNAFEQDRIKYINNNLTTLNNLLDEIL
jgi:hypothetical protein